jgi:sterol desaturase/sphingolipid hydroxylase (fatty acid hydroxylase superfamily)
VPYEDTRANYGNSLILLDRIFGTYQEGEASVVGQDQRKRLSIWEQTIFPFVPVIDRVKGRRAQPATAEATDSIAA